MPASSLFSHNLVNISPYLEIYKSSVAFDKISSVVSILSSFFCKPSLFSDVIPRFSSQRSDVALPVALPGEGIRQVHAGGPRHGGGGGGRAGGGGLLHLARRRPLLGLVRHQRHGGREGGRQADGRHRELSHHARYIYIIVGIRKLT